MEKTIEKMKRDDLKVGLVCYWEAGAFSRCHVVTKINKRFVTCYSLRDNGKKPIVYGIRSFVQENTIDIWRIKHPENYPLVGKVLEDG